MSGHSKWASIKHSKGKADKQRSKVFSKLSKEISVAAKLGDKDPAMNPRLRSAIQAAKSANMPKDNIERAIAKSSANSEINYENLRYEGFGPDKIAVIVEAFTDNKNRTVAEVRHAFTKAGGNLGTDGSVAYMFDNMGQFHFAPGADEEALMEVAIEVGAEDVETAEDGSIEVTTDPGDFLTVKEALLEAGFEPEMSELGMVAQNLTELDPDASEKVIRLIDHLEDLDDVQNVYTNAAFSDE